MTRIGTIRFAIARSRKSHKRLSGFWSIRGEAHLNTSTTSDMSLSKIAHLPQAKLSLVQQNGLPRTDVASGATALACGPWDRLRVW